jgi:hypothetical protein
LSSVRLPNVFIPCAVFLLVIAADASYGQAVDATRIREIFPELNLPVFIGEQFPTHLFHSAALGDRDAGFGPIPGSLQRAVFVSDQRVWRYAVGRIDLRDSIVLLTYRDFSTRATDEATYTIETFSPGLEEVDRLTIARRLSRVDRSENAVSMFRTHWSQAQMYEIQDGVRIVVWVTQAEFEIGRDDPDRYIRLRRDYLIRHDGSIVMVDQLW